jgi:hypothetical protein
MVCLSRGGSTGRFSRRRMMVDKEDLKREPAGERLAAFRDLPVEILEKLTKEEVKTFLYDDEWPDSLREKLEDYLTDPA